MRIPVEDFIKTEGIVPRRQSVDEEEEKKEVHPRIGEGLSTSPKQKSTEEQKTLLQSLESPESPEKRSSLKCS